MKTKVIFLIRAYNDFDCRLSLIMKCIKNPKFEVIITNYPTNNGYFNFQMHELFDHIKSKKLKFIEFVEKENLIIKSLYNLNLILQIFILKKIGLSRSQPLVYKFFSFFDKLVIFFTKNFSLLDNKIIKNSIIVLDEIILDVNRSFFLKNLIQLRSYKKLISIQTGQDTYLNLKRKNINSLKKNDEIIADCFLVPSKNDKKIFQRMKINNKIKVIGNPRFDPKWINYLNAKINKGIRKRTKYRCAFLLSKFEYGVKKNELFRVIEEVSNVKDCEIIIKPHTRGMYSDEIFSKFKANTMLQDGTQKNSTEIIKWSNIIFFTGSSIIFQAILQNKKCIYLDNAINCSTIFSNSKSVFHYTGVTNLKKLFNLKNKEKKDINLFLNNYLYNQNKKNLSLDRIINEIKC